MIKDFEKIRPSFDTKRQILGEIYPLSTPFNVILDISERCNFRCSYCFRSSSNRKDWGDYSIKNNLMSEEIFKKAVHQIMEFPEQVKKISLSGHGEPLCNSKITDMVRYIKKKGIKSKISIHTNGSLLSEQSAIKLAECGIDKIIISLQGLDEESYKIVCGFNIDFERFYKNLRILYKYKKPETLIYIKIMDIAVKNRESEFYDKFSQIADQIFIEKVTPIWKNMIWKNEESFQNKYGQKFPLQKCCSLLFHTFFITPDGAVYPCTQLLSKECLGNITENSLFELWNCTNRIELLRKQLMLCAPETCNECYIRQNSIFAKEDMIDDYRKDILERL